MAELSERTEDLLNVLFSDEVVRAEIRETLSIEFVSQNSRFRMHDSEDGMVRRHSKRLIFSVLRLSKGNAQESLEAIKLANTNWRDLLMAAGFGEDLDAHNKWYESKTKS